jgi:hypothetical protein
MQQDISSGDVTTHIVTWETETEAIYIGYRIMSVSPLVKKHSSTQDIRRIREEVRDIS